MEVLHYLQGEMHCLHVTGLRLAYGYIVKGHWDTHFCVNNAVSTSIYLYIEVLLHFKQNVALEVQVKQLRSQLRHK